MTGKQQPTERQQHFQQVFADITRSGVYHLPPGELDELIAAAEANAHVVFRVDLASARNKDSLLKAIGEGMAFPEWFGYNWDALADSLGDLGWRPAEGWLVILENADRINSRAHEDFVSALQIFSAAAEEWRERGSALWCLVDMHADGIAWLPTL